MSEVMIEAHGLTKRYEDFVALDGVDMSVRRGEVLGFLGPNGAGKSTTMKILTCYTAPSAGTAKVHGYDIFDNSLEVRQSIGYLPESTALYSDMLVLEYLQFMAEMRGIRGKQRTDRVRKVIEETHLEQVFAKEIRTLSKGYKQRVGLAQALIHEPPILILDEPMSGLDPNQAVEIRDLIKDIGRSRTVILSTHNLAEVQVACDRVLIIAKGRIVADDTPQGLLARSGKPRFLVALQQNDDTTAQACAEALGQLPAVDSVRLVDAAQPGEWHYEVLPETDEDLRAPLFQAAVTHGYTLLGLRREGHNLEQVFRELTTTTGMTADSNPLSALDAAE